MPGLLANHVGVTRNIVKVRFDLPEYTIERKAWGLLRVGGEIAQLGNRSASKAETPIVTENIIQLPGGGWSLTPIAGTATGLSLDDYYGAQLPLEPLPPEPTVGDPWNEGGHWEHNPSVTGGDIWIPDSRIPGASVTSEARNKILAARKEFAANQRWHLANMESDQEAFPGIDSSIYYRNQPMDRIMKSIQQHAENTGFALSWGGADTSYTPGPIISYYFGGTTQVTGTKEEGGMYALEILGKGEARLYERNIFNKDAGRPIWEHRRSFNWGSLGQYQMGATQLLVVPYGLDRFAFISPQNHVNMQLPQTSSVVSGGAMDVGTSRTNVSYIETESDAGHTHKTVITGKGHVRVDTLRTWRKVWQVSRIRYPEEGRLVDDVWAIKGPVAAGTPIRVTPDTFLLPHGGTLDVKVYDAKTHQPLERAAIATQHVFYANAGQSEYYCVFEFTRSLDTYRSPILWGYVVTVMPKVGVNIPQTVMGGNIRSVNIAGPSSDPTTESAGVEIKDPNNTLTKLQQHDGFRCDIVEIDTSTNQVVSRYFEGDIAAPESKFRGKLGRAGQFPAIKPGWRDYDNLKFVPLAGRLAEQVPLHMVSFFQDYDAPTDENGNKIKRPWTIPQVLRFCFADCGVPEDEIDIPAIYDVIRLWSSPKMQPADYAIYPGGDQSYLRLIQKICRDYLGAYLIRDPNAGPRGMWRVMPAKTAPYGQAIAAFYQYTAAYATGKILHHPDQWGTYATYIRDRSYREEIRRPEINYINVVGIGDIGENTVPKSKCEAEMYNLVSHNFFPGTNTAIRDHPDWLGRFVPGYLVDPGLIGQKAVDWTCRKIFDRACHAEKWVYWNSPYITIPNLDDPYRMFKRPLRVNDVVEIQRPNGLFEKAIIRSVNASWAGSDRCRWADYEAIFV